MRLWRWILRAWYSDLEPEEADRVAAMPYCERKTYLREKFFHPGDIRTRPLPLPSLPKQEVKAGLDLCREAARLASGAFDELNAGWGSDSGDLLELATLLKTTEDAANDLYFQLKFGPAAQEMVANADQLCASMQEVCGELNLQTSAFPHVKMKQRGRHSHVGEFAPLLRRIQSKQDAEIALETVKEKWDAAAQQRNAAALTDCINAAAWLQTYIHTVEARQSILRTVGHISPIAQAVTEEVDILIRNVKEMKLRYTLDDEKLAELQSRVDELEQPGR